MKITLLLVVILAACEKKEKPAPAPAPTPSPTEAKPAPTPEPEPGSAATDCELTVKIAGDKVDWEGRGQRGSSPKQPIDLSAVKNVQDTCGAHVQGDDKTTHQELVAVMDNLIANGVTNLSIGPPTDTATSKPKLGAAPNNPLLRNAPVIILTKTEAKVGETLVGAIDDPDLAAKIAAAIGTPKESVAVLQADETTPYPVIVRAIEGAKKAGCHDVLFAVKNR